VRHSKKFGITVAAASAALVAALAPAAQATNSVCNEREGSPKSSDLVPVGTPDPKPARGNMVVGNAKAKGLLNAAEKSPALTQCAPPTDGGPSGTGGGGSGDDGGITINT
jgi:hypothetical protein